MKKTIDLSFLPFSAMMELGWKYLGGQECCTYEFPDEDEYLFDFIDCRLN